MAESKEFPLFTIDGKELVQFIKTGRKAYNERFIKETPTKT
jgi:hypothetical protein